MLLEFLIPAFLIGLGGSLHCIGMCGPLMFSSLISGKNGNFAFKDWILYQTGRISIYTIWGITFGAIGSSVKWFGLQQDISLSLGIAILTVLLVTKVFPQVEQKISRLLLTQFWKTSISTFLQKRNNGSNFFKGMLNGILPCGLVYVALAGATAVQNPLSGGLFMLVFGVGTLPLLSALLFFSTSLQMNLRRNMTQWYPALIGLMAIMLIIRGLNMGNFFSPAVLPGADTVVHCASK
jgi:sulfite exporter TauE/SafE